MNAANKLKQYHNKMRKNLLLLNILLFSISGLAYGQKQYVNFTSVSLQPTVAYIKYEGHTRRMARLLFNNGKCYSGGELMVTFSNQTKTIVIPADKNGLEAYELPLPGSPVKISTQATVTLKADKQTYVSRCIIEPARENWTVYVLPHSHVDIGYTNIQAKVLKLHMR
jgi:alpha-mannosidase